MITITKTCNRCRQQMKLDKAALADELQQLIDELKEHGTTIAPFHLCKWCEGAVAERYNRNKPAQSPAPEPQPKFKVGEQVKTSHGEIFTIIGDPWFLATHETCRYRARRVSEPHAVLSFWETELTAIEPEFHAGQRVSFLCEGTIVSEESNYMPGHCHVMDEQYINYYPLKSSLTPLPPKEAASD